MREFKFRVWSKSSKKIYVQLNESPCFGLFEGDRAVSIEDVFFYEKQDFEVMQYTGEIDRNGKEIYEGDVIQTGHIVEEVRFGEFVIYDENENSICSVFGFFTELKNNSRYPLEVTSNTKVIGNKYENPELL
jgi:uncharacterized phage protein (TIGR01671 family)